MFTAFQLFRSASPVQQSFSQPQSKILRQTATQPAADQLEIRFGAKERAAKRARLSGAASGSQAEPTEAEAALLNAFALKATEEQVLQTYGDDAQVARLRQSGGGALHIAALKNDLANLKNLMERGANQNAGNQDGHTPLHLAAQKGHTAVVNTLLLADANKNATTQKGATPLHLAAITGNVEGIKALLAADANRDAAIEDGATPLHLAIWKGNTAAVQALLAAGANQDAVTTGGVTPLHLAASKGHLGIVNELLAAGANPNARNAQNKTPFYYAPQNLKQNFLHMIGWAITQPQD